MTRSTLLRIDLVNVGVPFRLLAAFLTITASACAQSHVVGGTTSTESDASVYDSATPDAGSDVAQIAVRPGCPIHVRLEGRDSSVPVDVIWVVLGNSELLRSFREATEHYWAAIQTGEVDTMNILIVPHENVLPGPPGGFAGRIRYITGTSRDPGFGLLEAHEFYASVLRPDSRRHVVVVSSGTTRFTSENLHRALLDQLGDDYTLHAIVSEQLEPSVDNPLGVCSNSMGSADRGDMVFTAIAGGTSGTVSSICAEDWNGLVDRLSERIAIRVPIPCAFSLPIIRPPGVRTYNERDIRLSATRGESTELLRNVEDPSQCYAGDWWLYQGSDRVHLCPDACEEIERTQAALDVELACGS